MAPLLAHKDGGGGVDGSGGACAEPPPWLAGGVDVCRGRRPAESGQEGLCGGWGLGVQVEQVPEEGAPWRRTGE